MDEIRPALKEFLSSGLSKIAEMSIKQLKSLIKRLEKDGSPQSIEGIAVVRKIIEQKKSETIISIKDSYGINTYGLGRQNFCTNDAVFRGKMDI